MTRPKSRANGDGDVYPRKNKAGKVTGYRGGVRAPDGRRRYVSGRTKKEAREALREARSNAAGGLVFDAGKLTVGEYLDRWLSDSVRGSVRDVTHASYAHLTKKHIKPAIGAVKLSGLTPAHLQGFYRSKLDSGLSPRTVRYLHAVLHRALKQALRWGLIPRNVAAAVDPPQISKKPVTPLSPTEARTFLEAARGDRLEALYVLAIHTGMRQGEMLGLRWDDADLDAGILRVRGTKSARSRRTVKLSRTALEALRSHRKRQAEERLRLGSLWRDEGLVFASEVGGTINPSNLRNRSFKPFLEVAGLPDIRFHDLRHTCATLLLCRGVHAKFVQELLGHATIAITLDTYSHVMPGMDSGAADAMDEALS